MVLLDDSPPEREASPDWLHAFQTPLKDFTTLYSSSPSSSSHDATVHKAVEENTVLYKRRQHKVLEREHLSDVATTIVDVDTDDDEDEVKKVFSTRGKGAKKNSQRKGQKDATSPVSEDQREKGLQMEFEQSPQAQLVKIDEVAGNMRGETQHEDEDHVESRVMFTVLKNEEMLQEGDIIEGQERRTKQVASTTLPLMFADKVHRSKVLLECEGDALDLSGDVGAVGRFSICNRHEGNDEEVLFDLKGVIYKTTIVPSNSFFVVNIGQSDAKVEAVMNDFVQLQANTNIYEAETMVEGTLEGFTFDSDDDGERAPAALGTTAGNKDDEKDGGERPLKKKVKTDKALKTLQGSEKTNVKAGTSKLSGKVGSARKMKPTGKSAKKTANSKKVKTPKKVGARKK